MGRLFTYMVKAAAGERQRVHLTGEDRARYLRSVGLGDLVDAPVPTYNYFTPYGVKRDALPTGAYSLPFDRRGWIGDRRTRRWNSVDNLYGASTDVDKWQDLNTGGGNNWGTAYVTAVNPAFISPEAIAQFLDAHPEYERELIRAAQTRGGPHGFDFRDGGSDTPSYLTISNSPYAVDEGRVNIQLALNLAKAYRERAERQDAEAAERKKVEDDARDKQGDGSDTGVVVDGLPQPGPHPSGRTSEVQSSNTQTATAGEPNPFLARIRSMAGTALQQWRAASLSPEYRLRARTQQNIAAGRSMYDGMTSDTEDMTVGQKLALTTPGFVSNQPQQATTQAAAQGNVRESGQQPPQSEYAAYTGAGLRMVGHSADGNTRTYVGKSGRGRITVGDNAQAGHYRGVGAVDTNTRSNYADIRQPNATRAVAVSPVRKSPTTPTTLRR